MKTNLIRLTQVQGELSRPVYINPDSIQRFWESQDGGTYLVFTNSADIITKESPEAIFHVVNALNK